MYLVIRVMEL